MDFNHGLCWMNFFPRDRLPVTILHRNRDARRTFAMEHDADDYRIANSSEIHGFDSKRIARDIN